MKPSNNFVKLSSELKYFKEPNLIFGHKQALENPKDGLTLFGPYEKSLGIEYGVIGTKSGIENFKEWTSKLNNVIEPDPKVSSSVLFPGFEALFETHWLGTPSAILEIDEKELLNSLRIYRTNERVYHTVELFYDKLVKFKQEEDKRISLWFVVIPENVWKNCRPLSKISKKEAIKTTTISTKRALLLQDIKSLFDEENAEAKLLFYEGNFHNQLKARLLGHEIITQIVRETTIAPQKFKNKSGYPIRSLQDQATVTWNLSTAIYYKSGKKPWSLASLREGVCYIGLVFKRSNNPKDSTEACCGAQLFLNTGEGIVFKGSVGSFASEKYGEFHLNKNEAKKIVEMCVETFKLKQGKMPTELYIHGRTRFNQHEIDGFREGVPDGTEITGIQIRKSNELKLYRQNSIRPIMRGHAYYLDSRNAFLWTNGYIPHLKTYPGREVPNPLRIRIVFGQTDLDKVLNDIMALTKLNFNSCIFADGYPVTLRFADNIGEILTAIPETTSKPLPFRNYI